MTTPTPATRRPSAAEITERILDAAVACFAATGVRRTTMNAVADEAGVGVATVYRRYAQKEQLFQAVLVREVTQLIDIVQQAIAGADSYQDQVADGFVTFATQLGRRDLLRDITDTDLEFATGMLPGRGSPILSIGRAFIADILGRFQAEGKLGDFDTDLVAEIFARLAYSLAMTPDGLIPLADPQAARAFARSYLLPLLHPLPID